MPQILITFSGFRSDRANRKGSHIAIYLDCDLNVQLGNNIKVTVLAPAKHAENTKKKSALEGVCIHKIIRSILRSS